MIVNQKYHFTPPSGPPDRPIVVLALQDYSPGQQRKTDVWKIEPPEGLAVLFGNHVEFDSYRSLIAMLATTFCQGDQAVAAERLVAVRTGTEQEGV